MTFNDLPLDPSILKALAEAGYETPTPIQLKAIPKVVRGFDIRASAQTGTGKTAAFLLPALNRLTTPAPTKGKGPRVLILAPTRELAMQIATQSEKYSKCMPRIKSVCVWGGVPYERQLRKLSKPYDVLIATPGRLLDFMEQGKIDFSRIEMLILDEADRMLDMGFLEPVEEICAATPSTRQTLLFSATLDKKICKLSDRLLNKPMDIVVQGEKEQHENIEQRLYHVDDLYHKNRMLDHILKEEKIHHMIIFTSTKRHAGELARELKEKKHRAVALHGDMNQRQRTRTIGLLKEGKVQIVVATDVAARGIDVQSISHVVNFDLPRCAEDYVHRIGRTGRAGATGIALSFASGHDAHLLKKIREFTGQKMEADVIEGLEPRPRKKAAGGPPKKKWGGSGFKKKGTGHYSKSKKKTGFQPAAKRGFKGKTAKKQRSF